MNALIDKDLKEFVDSFPLKEDYSNSTFLITGGTGLIGSMLVRCLLATNKGIKFILPVRSRTKAISIFGNLSEVIIIQCDLVDYLHSLKEDIDYIIHCASPTAGIYMKEHPVETFELAIESTRLLLDFACRHRIKGMVYLSSIEYYGQILSDDVVLENTLGYVNPLDSRSSYPLGKRAAEYLCVAYAEEYGVPVKIARLTQTFGAGVSSEDNRVFAQFSKSIINGSDIVLHTTGEASKPYCYTTDCVSAILYIMLRGKTGEAYNVSNPNTYISIKDLALFLKDRFNPEINVRVELHPEKGYAPVTKLNLSSEKLIGLGWRPQYSMEEMFARLIQSLKIK